MPRRPIDRFLVRVLLWLAPAFVVWWYVLGSLLLLPVAGWTHWILAYCFPQAIAAVEPQDITVNVVTRFLTTAPAHVAPSPGAQAQLIFTINALKYTYGLPLLLALTLAAPTEIGDKLYRAIMGSVVFMLIPVWGIACEALKVLVFQMGPAIAAQMGTTPLTRELLALAYQLGYLILPAVAPILIWAALHRDFLRVWLPQARQGPSVSSPAD